MVNNNFYIGIIVGLIMMFILIDIRDKCYIKSDTVAFKDNIIKILIRQAARWTTAAEQDENSMIAVLHANYGAGYLWAVKDFASDNDVKRATNIDMKKFTRKIVGVQDKMTKNMAKLCPKYAPKRSYLTRIGGEGN